MSDGDPAEVGLEWGRFLEYGIRPGYAEAWISEPSRRRPLRLVVDELGIERAEPIEEDA